MAFLFKNKAKSPGELVSLTKAAIEHIRSGDDAKHNTKAAEDVSKHLQAMKGYLYGDGEMEPQPENIAQLAQEAYNSDLLLTLVLGLEYLEFEARKDVAQIFNSLLRRQIGTRFPTVEHVCASPAIVDALINGYGSSETALNCGSMIRECVKHETLSKMILSSQYFYKLFSYVESTSFDVATDAFLTLKETLTTHSSMCAEFLEVNYDQFFEEYTKLLSSENYVTRRQSLKLLGEVLLDRDNFNVMTKYITSPTNLKLMMTLLRDKGKNIQFEAFHVFKVFVANPNKPPPIVHILYKNRDRLISYLSEFHTERTDDDQFNEEKAFLIKEIGDLQPIKQPESTLDVPAAE